jgi:hypothetical protein
VTEPRPQPDAAGGSTYELATALLVGLIAVIVAILVVLEVSTGHVGARAESAAARLASVAATRNNVSQAPNGFRISKILESTQLGMEGTTRQLVALEAGDRIQQAIGAADQVAWERLMALAEEMGEVPDASSPLDPYSRYGLASKAVDIAAMVVEQNRQADRAAAAGGRGAVIVLGISLAALAGVLGGLAAVIRRGRPGAALLALGYVAAAIAIVLAAAGSGRF